MNKQKRFQGFEASMRASINPRAQSVFKNKSAWLALLALSSLLPTVNAAYAVRWQTVSPREDWTCIAASADGARFVAAASVGSIYTSGDSGNTWVRTGAPRTNWSAVASSADGNKLVAVVGSSLLGNYTNAGLIYISTNSGGTWTPTTAPANSWAGVASSADGLKLVAVVGGYSVTAGGPIYTSTNSGATWTITGAPIKIWSSVASSADGGKLVATAFDGSLYTSTNAGISWNPRTSPAQYLAAVVSSSDGTRLLVGADVGVYLSVNSGLSWAPTPVTTNAATWFGVACSSDGSHLFAAGYDSAGAVYQSSNFGNTWTETSAPSSAYAAVACSANGSQWVATTVSGSILAPINVGPSWTRSTTPPITNWTGFASSADGSWLVGATGYGLTGSIFISTNSGVNWVRENAPSSFYSTTACSADGTIIAVVGSRSDEIFASRDAGLTWNLTSAPELFWRSLTVSADGGKWLVASDQGALYKSTDAGVSFKPVDSAPSGVFNFVSSADGVISVVFTGSGIYVSTNSTASWSQVNALANDAYVAGSLDAEKLVACGNSANSVEVSTNSGTSWIPTGVPYANWTSVASSADGIHLVATANNFPHDGQIATSIDGGTTWILSKVPGKQWQSIVSSADGGQLAVQTAFKDAATSGEIYYSKSTPTPALTLALGDTNAVVAWTIPSMDFHLQENASFETTNWIDVPVSTVLNLSNLQNQATLARTNGTRFFRLVHP